MNEQLDSGGVAEDDVQPMSDAAGAAVTEEVDAKVQQDDEEDPPVGDNNDAIQPRSGMMHISDNAASGSANVKKEAEQDTSSQADTADQKEDRPWDFSNRKVLVEGVMKFCDVKTVTKMIDKWLPHIQPQVAYDKIKKPPKGTWMVVTVKEESMVQPFIDYVNNNDIRNKKGKKMVAKVATDTDDSVNNNKKRHSARDDDRSSKRQKKSIGSDYEQEARRFVTEEEVKDKITPLWRLSTEEQLDAKMKTMIKKCAIKIIQEIKAKFRQLSREKGRKHLDLYAWVAKKRGITVEPIVSAPTPLRNKCEFTFGYRYLADKDKQDNNDTTMQQHSNNYGDSEPPKVPAVGFMCMGWAGGVSHPKGLCNIPEEVCALVDIFDKFLLNCPLPPYDSKLHKGFWRLLTIRTSRRTQECMIIVQHTPAASGGQGEMDESFDFTKEFETERARLISLLIQAELPTTPNGPFVKVTSIFFQEFEGLSSPPPEHPVQHAYGKTYLSEKLGKCNFQISPGSFFQVNTEGAEILYQLVVDKVKEVSDDPAKTLLFDVCCGTGTIGMTCMKEGVVGQVIGVDVSEPAIEDAKKNAVLNGYETGIEDSETVAKTRFVAARAEQVLGQEIHKAKKSDMKFVAIVDPAREGLHADVVKALRANERIGRLVYVSCNPTASLIRDAGLLCSPATKKYSGRPFQITSALPVDMFPLTNHCEMVMTFDRLLSDTELDEDYTDT